ncbi:uncharacterized protein JCM6883_004198 [Sporobolomyces salmoneus]|uniref:uncharacterized protein n=1 Tax=Sporobolomyces salmoneus TaxID=183962 RepID=UPI0031716BEF
MSAAALKAEGNDLFAEGDWESALERYTKALELVEESDFKTSLLSNRSACFIKLCQFDKALVDGNLCIKLRPNWSRGYARCGEAYSRLQSFRLARVAYSEAIRTAEDKATKSRYVASLQTVKQGLKRQESVKFVSSAAKAFSRPYHGTWFQRFLHLKESGYEEKRGGGMAMMLQAWNSAATGWFTVDNAIVGRIGDQFYGKAGTSASLDFSECILLDHGAFAIPANGYRDPRYSFRDKFFALLEFEFHGLGLMEYFRGRRWTAKEIIADLAKRKKDGEVWNTIRIMGATLIRAGVLLAFTKALDNKHAEAIEDLQLAIELIDEGNKVWPDVPFTEKGSSFRPTIRRMIKVEAMHYRIEGNQMATSESGKVAFSLESIESAAKTIIKENPQGQWKNADDVPAREVHWTRLGYYVMPTVRANEALGYCSAQRARASLEPVNLLSDSVAVADRADAEKAARHYDLAYKLLPNDYYRKPLIGFQALEQHLLAGGKTVKQILDQTNEVCGILQALVPMFTELEQPEAAQTFVIKQFGALFSWLTSPSPRPLDGVARLNEVLKPIPTLNVVTSNLEIFDESNLLTRAFWDSLPGDVALDVEVRTARATTQ